MRVERRSQVGLDQGAINGTFVNAVRGFLRSARTFVARRRVPVIAGAVVIALVGSLGIWWGVTGGDLKMEAVDCSTLEADDFGNANALAIACGEDVEVTGERTPWQTSWAGPNGTSTLEASSVPTRTLIDGEWVPIDADLVVEEDGIHVAAPTFPMSINPGGAAGAGQPLGTIERDGYAFEMWFPLDLPVPTLDGSHIVYDLIDGVRLIVTVNPDTTGFIPVVELRDPDAAARFRSALEAARAEDGIPGSGIDLGFTVKVSGGLALSIDGDRQMHAIDESGEDQFFSPPPSMWDSSGEDVHYGEEVTEVASTDRAVQPSGGDAVAGMGVALDGDTLIVTPDPEMLESSDTVWPIYIDPSISGVGAAERIAIRTGGYTSTLYQWTNISSSSTGQGTGYCTDASCTRTFTQRLMWRFTGLNAIADLAGADIQSAYFNVNGVHSYNCTAREAYLFRVGDFNSATSWGSSSWQQNISSRTESQRASCGTNGVKSFTATAASAWLADTNSTVMPLGLYVPETSMAYWKRYAHDATLTVTYNRAPNVPTSLQLTSPSVTTCVTGTGRPAIATTTPTLSAIVSDPDGGTVMPSFDVYTTAGTGVWSSGNQAAILSGNRGSVAVPAAKLVNGQSYMWRAIASDGSRYGAWSGWCEFLVDTTAPSVPTVTPATTGVAAVYPENAERGGVGLLGSFTLNRGSSSDVVVFNYQINSGVLQTATPDGSGNAVISYTPTSAGPVTLTVRSKDAAGNQSAVRTYVFTVVSPTEDGIWTLDEGTGLTAQDTAGSPARPLTVSGATWGDGPHALFDSRPGDHALEFDGTDDYAAAGAPVVDTTESFAVSAHVLLDPSRVEGPDSFVAFSQDGVAKAGFRVEYRASCPGMANGCWAFVMIDSATTTAEVGAYSTVPVSGGEWTLLVAQYEATTNSMQLLGVRSGDPNRSGDRGAYRHRDGPPHHGRLASRRPVPGRTQP